MIRRVTVAAALCALAAGSMVQARAPQSPRIKVIADQDSAGPQGTNFLSLLMLLNAPGVDLLGITTGSGDHGVHLIAEPRNRPKQVGIPVSPPGQLFGIDRTTARNSGARQPVE